MYAPAFPPGSGPDVFKGQAVAHWYDETHARRAMEELHCLEVEGSTITVQVRRLKPYPLNLFFFF